VAHNTEYILSPFPLLDEEMEGGLSLNWLMTAVRVICDGNMPIP